MAVLFFDHDQVTCDLHAAWLRRLAEKRGIHMTKEQIRNWDTLAEHLDLLLAPPDIYLEVEPKPGAVEVIRRLMEAGYTVEMVTAAMDENIPGKRAWFRRHMPFLPPDAIHFSYRKHRFAGQGVLFDDAPHNIENFRKAGGTAVVFDQIYNRHLPGPRVHNWYEIEAWVRQNIAPSS